jgi:ATP-dependent RNA circularization protein (DNA/RNA ligase family)
MQKQQGFEQRAEELQQQAGRRQQELMEPIMQRVEQVISEVRQAEGFAIVFDVASEAIVSADPSLDLTTRVIARLRAAPAARGRRHPRTRDRLESLRIARAVDGRWRGVRTRTSRVPPPSIMPVPRT